MRAFFPEGLTVGRAGVFYKRERTKREERISHRGHRERAQGTQRRRLGEREAGWWGSSLPVINWWGFFTEED
jgi:hypothetical protein